jgi:steroid 5-alpha reductase family enzyme
MGRASRGMSFVYCGLVYLLALAAAFLAFRLFRESGVLFATFLADVAATIVVWFCGVLMKNASLYDPYWSVAPLVILPLWLWTSPAPVGEAGILYLIALYPWGLRLTYNWANRWQGLQHQDWRYTMFRDKNPKLWFITNLCGINLMPTVLVFLGMIPAYCAVTAGGGAGILSYLGLAVCLGAAFIQAVADRQMEDFKRSGAAKDQHIDSGLWRISRHPNYLGEISFWWGIWIMQMGVMPLWWTIAGPVAITLLFVYISIPMMERHIEASRPGYAAYKKEVPMLVPFIKRSGR